MFFFFGYILYCDFWDIFYDFFFSITFLNNIPFNFWSIYEQLFSFYTSFIIILFFFFSAIAIWILYFLGSSFFYILFCSVIVINIIIT